MEAVATCRPGLEAVVAAELNALGIAQAEIRKRAVTFRCDSAGLYRVNMGLRAAIQVLVPLRQFRARDYDLLYHQCRKTPWHKLFAVDKSIRVDVSGRSPQLRNSQYVVHRIKDAIVDTFKKLQSGARPSVDKDEPEVHVVAHLHGDEVTLCLDSSGASLFKRGYRTEHGEAPIKEDLAAGILLACGYGPGRSLVDPVCGSGTFLFEGWMIERNVAPNLRRGFAFQHWADYDEAAHVAQRDALEQAQLPASGAVILGGDCDPRVVALAQRIRETSFADSGIRVECVAAAELAAGGKATPASAFAGGLMVANPPYGERMGDPTQLNDLYRSIGYAAKRLVPGGRLAVFTTNRAAARQVRLKQDRSRTFFNGALEGVLYEYALQEAKEPNNDESVQPAIGI